MKRFLGIFFISFFVILLQGNLRYLPWTYFRMDLILLTVFYVSFFVPFYSGVFFILFMGFIYETWSLPFHGPLLFTYLVFYFFLRSFHKNLFFQEDASQVLWVFVLSFVYRWMLHFILNSLNYSDPINLISIIFFCFLEGMISIALFPLFDRVLKENEDSYAY